MLPPRSITLALVVALAVSVATSTSALAVPLPPGSLTLPANGSYVYLNSEPGDPVGGGSEQLFTVADGKFATWMVPGGSTFTGRFLSTDSTKFITLSLAGASGQPLAIGPYTNAASTDWRGADQPLLRVSVNGNGCYATGSFDIAEMVFDEFGEIAKFDVTFEQRCDGATGSLFGRFRIDVPPPVPGVTLPSGSITVPSAGTFLYLLSQPGDLMGGGNERLFTPVESTVRGTLWFPSYFSANSYQIVLSQVKHSWVVAIRGPRGESLHVGSYVGALGGFSSTHPELFVAGDLGTCDRTNGKFDVDELSFWPTGELRVFQATFEQHCYDLMPALFGRIRIDNPPPEPTLELAVTFGTEPTVDVKTGMVTVTGTVECSRTASVDVFGLVTETLQSTYSIGATIMAHTYCTAPSAPWIAQVPTYNPQFMPDVGSLTVRAETCDSRCYTVGAYGTVHLNAGTSR